MAKKDVHAIPSGRICIYGTGSGGKNAFDEIAAARPDVTVVCFLDSFREGTFLGYPVYKPEHLAADGPAYDYILVASAYSFEIGVHLVELGLPRYLRFYFTWDTLTPPPESHETWLARCRDERYAMGPDGRLRLPQLDLNLTEHCNLSCAGCNHFCPLAPPWFYDPNEARRELDRLSRFVATVDRFFIVGGEPLLHPDVTAFFEIARERFPGAELALWTNGTRLERMPEHFWEACRTHDVRLRLTNYPRLRHKTPALARLIREKLGAFYGFDREDCCLMLTTAMRPGKSLSRCGLDILTLSRGSLYHCPYEAYVHMYNAAFAAQFPERQGYDLFAPKASAQGLLDYLVRPSALCHFCRDKDELVLVDWSSDWNRPGAWVLEEGQGA